MKSLWSHITIRRVGMALVIGIVAALVALAAARGERTALRLMEGLATAIFQRPARFAAGALLAAFLGWAAIGFLCLVEWLQTRRRNV